MSKIVAIWGGNGVGKTTLSAALANELTKDKSTRVLIVNNDNRAPAYATWMPDYHGLPIDSAGDILNNPDLDRDYLLSEKSDSPFRTVPCPANKNIALIGYLQDDNIEKYNPLQTSTAYEFFNVVKLDIPEVDMIIVDASDPEENSFSKVALDLADIVITMIEPNTKGIAFMNAMGSTINQLQKSGQTHHIILSPTFGSAPVSTMRNRFDIAYYETIKYSEEAKQKFDSCQLFTDYRKDKSYSAVLKRLTNEIQGG